MTVAQQERTQSATVQKLIDGGQSSLCDFFANIMAVVNGQYSDISVGDLVTFRMVPRPTTGYAPAGTYVVEYAVEPMTEQFRKDVCKSFSEEVVKSYGPVKAATAGCCGGTCSTNSQAAPSVGWKVVVKPSQKGLNIPRKALDYLIPVRTEYTPLFVRPLDGSTDKFLVNASEGLGDCWTVFPHQDGRYIINITTQRKAFKSVIARKNFSWSDGTWTVMPNGSTGNSCIFTMN